MSRGPICTGAAWATNKTDLLGDVVQGVGGVDSEANQDDVRIGVRQRSETVVVLLTSRIPQCQLNVSAIDLDIGNVVLKDGRDVDLDVVLAVLRGVLVQLA